jgi:hypothetical protein
MIIGYSLMWVVLCFFSVGYADTDLSIKGAPPQIMTLALQSSCVPCAAFHDLNTLIRDGQIKKHEAVVRFRVVMSQLKAYAAVSNPKSRAGDECVFPLQGYGPEVIGGKQGSGYILDGYDYFDGNKHLGHPAHDLFIRDRNQDSLDDESGRPVIVLSMEEGLVVSVETVWQDGSRLRGGRYLWIFNPADSRLTYYAHNERILVKIGDWVKPGDPIATVGRTGYNAGRKRSPTHLHLMQLKIQDGRPEPENRFQRLSSGCGCPKHQLQDGSSTF